MNPLSYIWDLFETNHFTLHLALFLLGLSLIKYLKLPAFLSKKQALLAVILIGVVLRVLWLGFSSYEAQTKWNPKHMLESDLTNMHAADLTRGVWFEDGDGKPMARRPIGYPMALGLAYKVFGVTEKVADAFNLVLFIVGVYLVYLVGRELFSETAGVLAAFFYSIHPTSIYSVKLITDEHLFLPLWYLGLYFLVREIKGRPVRWSVLWYGLIFGYAAMTRTHVIFMPATVLLAYALLKYSWKKTLAAAFGVALIMQLINVPWIVRNYKAWGVPVVYTDNAFFIYSALNSTVTPEGNGGRIPEKGEKGYSEELEQARLSGNSALYHKLCNREMKRWILENPVHFLLLGSCRAVYFMGWNRAGVWPIWFQFYEGSYDPARPIPTPLRELFEETAYSFYYALFFCWLFSIAFIVRRWKSLEREKRIAILAVASIFVFWLMEHMIIYPDRKYRFPLEPLMMLSAAYFLEHVLFAFDWRNVRLPFVMRKKEARGA